MNNLAFSPKWINEECLRDSPANLADASNLSIRFRTHQITILVNDKADVLQSELHHHQLLDERDTLLAPEFIAQGVHHTSLLIVVGAILVLLKPLLKCFTVGVVIATEQLGSVLVYFVKASQGHVTNK